MDFKGFHLLTFYTIVLYFTLLFYKPQKKQTMNTQTTKQIDFTRINNDINGNPRFVCHFLNLINETDQHCTEGWGIRQNTVLYDIAVKRANKLGGRKFHNKQYGGGIVFQMYEGQKEEMSRRIYEIVNQ